MAKDSTASLARSGNRRSRLAKSTGAPKSPGRRRFIAGLGAATAAVSTGVLAPIVAATSASARETPDFTTQSAVGASSSASRFYQQQSVSSYGAAGQRSEPGRAGRARGERQQRRYGALRRQGRHLYEGSSARQLRAGGSERVRDVYACVEKRKVLGFRKDHRRRHAHAKRSARRSGLRPRSARQRAVRPAAGASRSCNGQRPERHRTARALLGVAASRRGLHRLWIERAGRCRRQRSWEHNRPISVRGTTAAT